MAEEKKKPVLFGKDHAQSHPHHVRWLNKAIRSNRWGKDNNVTITYRKEDGSTSERKVKPIAAKKHLLLAHDHSRNAIRSFHLDRIQKMEKSAFQAGFEKKAGML
jgi:predicted DNA-binding transcriptional regulator YafY